MEPRFDKVSSVIFVTHKKEISVIYKPTPVTDKDELVCIIGNMFDESSSPAFFKIDLEKSDRAAPSLSIPRFPPSSVPRFHSSLIQ